MVVFYGMDSLKRDKRHASQRAPTALSFFANSPLLANLAVSSPPPMKSPPTNTRGTFGGGGRHVTVDAHPEIRSFLSLPCVRRLFPGVHLARRLRRLFRRVRKGCNRSDRCLLEHL